MISLLKKRPLRRTTPEPRREPRAVDVDGRSLALQVRDHPRATRMTLRIDPGGRALSLTVPRGLAEREIDAFLSRQQGWLMTRLAGLPEEAGLAEGATLPIRGIDHRIERTGRIRGLTQPADIDGTAVLLVGGAEEHLGRRVADHLKREARKDLEIAVARHAATIDRRVRRLSIKDTKSRWGSCTSEGSLSFSWRIVMAPSFVLDYLAAHEVAHLKEMNHGPDFWALCTRLCSETKPAKAWLKRNGSRLQAYDFT